MAESNNSAVVNNENPLKLSSSKSGQSSELQEKSKTDKGEFNAPNLICKQFNL